MEGRKQTSILSHFSPKTERRTSPLALSQIENKHLALKSITSTPKNLSNDRKSLKTIQLTKQENALTRDTPASTKSKPTKPNRIHTCDKAIPIYRDPSPEAVETQEAKKDDSTQTETEKCWCQCHEGDSKKEELSPEEEAHLLMVQEEVPEEYWKELAEQRRDALNETLEENEQLHRSLCELKEENRRLSELAEHGEKLAKFLTDVANENSESENKEGKEHQEVTEKEDCEDNTKKEGTNDDVKEESKDSVEST